MERIMRFGIVVVILGLMVGCGEDGEDNSLPVINSFTASATEVVTNAEVTLTVLATDPDGDDLAYTYSSTGGTITGTGNTVTWVAPDVAGDCTITVDVSDGELNAQNLITITVVTPETPPVTMEGMVLIPAGEFQMGDHFNEGHGNELPVHTVYLDAFYLDIYEVTNAQYGKFMNATGHSAPRYWNNSSYNAPEQPVVGVSWHDAVAYAEWAGKRLPTEAEWEKAARGGLIGKRYPWGDEAPDAGGVYRANYYAGDNSAADGYEYAAPVGSFPSNGYGLYDMAGNVWEWCADGYDSSYYANSPRNNPLGPGSGSSRVLRGGSWFDITYHLRVSYRSYDDPTRTYYYVGFRCVSQD